MSFEKINYQGEPLNVVWSLKTWQSEDVQPALPKPPSPQNYSEPRKWYVRWQHKLVQGWKRGNTNCA